MSETKHHKIHISHLLVFSLCTFHPWHLLCNGFDGINILHIFITIIIMIITPVDTEPNDRAQELQIPGTGAQFDLPSNLYSASSEIILYF